LLAEARTPTYRTVCLVVTVLAVKMAYDLVR